MRKSKNAQSKSKNTRGHSASPTNVIFPNVQASSGSSSTSAPKPVTKSTQPQSNKRAKTAETSTMDRAPEYTVQRFRGDNRKVSHMLISTKT